MRGKLPVSSLQFPVSSFPAVHLTLELGAGNWELATGNWKLGTGSRELGA
jgi:hypothetical protein